MRHPLWYLGFLSLPSLLYVIRGDPGFLLFLSFLMFFFTYWTKTDERVAVNIGRASRNAFLYTMIIGAASIIYVNLVQDSAWYQWMFALVITGALSICVLSFMYYDSTGR
ncbi:MAG: DUF3796 domain-containing protein [Candidatus Thermoplasmatota archaeon]|nr:DUF3796 domain-containing protein [Candidatus Thermoplasmatota archaeon]